MNQKFDIYYPYFVAIKQIGTCKDIRNKIFYTIVENHIRRLDMKNLTGCNLKFYILDNHQYKYYNMSNSIACDLTINNINLYRVNLSAATITNCQFIQPITDIMYYEDGSHSYMDWTGAQISDCTFCEIYFDRAKMKNTKFTGCKFMKSIFHKINFSQTIFEKCKYINCWWDECK